MAHLGYFREELVARRGWIDDAAYADLVALCQFLPGPASSQVVFALGMHRAGLAGAFLGSLCFTLPSAALMILFAYGVSALGNIGEAGWLHGLKLAAVAVVAQAVWGMGRKLCPDLPRLALALGSASVLIALPGAAVQVGVIIAGGIIGGWVYRTDSTVLPQQEDAPARSRGWAAAALVVFAVLLVALPALAAASGDGALKVFDGFYRSGSLVFGGGHVVLPLLRAEVVPPGWVSDDAFLAGYGAAQALPGPLFTFAGYLGTVMHPGGAAWAGGLWALLAIFLPSWLLVGGALPFWTVLRSRAWAQAALRGTNAAVVGILLAAFYDPVWREAVTGLKDVAAAIIAFSALEFLKCPPWLLVLVAAGAGAWLL